MVYVPADRYIWDFWFAPKRPGEPYHAFFLQAPRDLPDPELRHGMAEVGHAVSHDLVNWEPRPTALRAAPAGNWDDRAIWTGSIIEHDGRWWWFYTALERGGFVQRIGLATTTDPTLNDWERHPANPIMTPDPAYYAGISLGPHGPEQACRDPWVVWSNETGDWRMFFTANANDEILGDGPPEFRGVIGRARSSDLIHWEQLPPVTEVGILYQWEVPQHLALGGRHYLLFCSDTTRPRLWHHGTAWVGTHYLVADHLDGPYGLVTTDPHVGDDIGTYYAGRVIEGPTGEPVFMAWRQWTDHGTFLGGLSNPAPLTVLPDGRLHVDQSQLWPQ